ncbi:hypothetical protein [uncultured Phascolarctobacterium sp.]|uniref:hypothetical protein n=1 Tax=uncultured Phascolarctobacterium sp. TaxID=512296 RepID=UPI002622C811|nr:hypothetical protein [uncultured Phascolarctobacterium sp.]
MSLKRTFLAGLMALCLGVSSLAAADGIYVKRDSMGRKIGQLLYVDAGVMRYPAIFAILYYERVTKGVEAWMQEHN